MLSGCSTTANFSHTPSDSSEFKKDISELKRNYSDIEEYDRMFASPETAPTKDDLEKLWGTPATRKNWGVFALNFGLCVGLVSAGYLTYPVMAAVYLMNPIPTEEYVWEKGNYQIVAQGRSDAFVRYEKRIHRWEWKEKSSAEDLALNAKQSR